MRHLGPRVIAVVSVLCSAGSALLTNLITSRWSWTAAAGLAAVIVTSSALAWWDRSAAPARTTIVQRATDGSQISHATLHASGRAGIRQEAVRGGRIDGVRLAATEGEISQAADAATITASDLSTEP